ncbi:MAG: glycosyltransferase [Planctomycetales bacterium]|nr:glycosyltransferase [Planctomycetales bacterium]
MTIDVCLLACNRERITRTSVAEIGARTTTPHRLVVLDNGSTDGTEDLLASLVADGQVDVLLWYLDNYGVHLGHNTLLENVDSELYVSTDNDLVPQAPTEAGDWLGLLIDLMRRHPDYAAIACLPHFLVGDSLARWLDGAGEVIERPWCGAALRLMRTEAVQQAGGWRATQNPSRNNEERWICGKLRENGWKTGYARDVRCIHLWGEPERGEDAWGYPAGFEHGHRPVHPPPDRYNWHRLGINWETCK